VPSHRCRMCRCAAHGSCLNARRDGAVVGWLGGRCRRRLPSRLWGRALRPPGCLCRGGWRGRPASRSGPARGGGRPGQPPGRRPIVPGAAWGKLSPGTDLPTRGRVRRGFGMRCGDEWPLYRHVACPPIVHLRRVLRRFGLPARDPVRLSFLVVRHRRKYLPDRKPLRHRLGLWSGRLLFAVAVGRRLQSALLLPHVGGHVCERRGLPGGRSVRLLGRIRLWSNRDMQLRRPGGALGLCGGVLEGSVKATFVAAILPSDWTSCSPLQKKAGRGRRLLHSICARRATS
jgi:hypothetical protein